MTQEDAKKRSMRTEKPLAIKQIRFMISDEYLWTYKRDI